MIRLRVWSLMATLLFCGFAQRGWAGSQQEAEFLFQIHEINRAEIQTGLLAQFKGNSEEVRKYGRTLVDHHTQAEIQVLALAKELGLSTLTGIMNPDLLKLQMRHDLIFTELLLAPLGKFDALFAARMAKAHEDAVALVRGALPSLASSNVHQFAQALIPVLLHHQNIAFKLMN